MWIGVDVTVIGELRALLARRWFREYVYAPGELAAAAGLGPERAEEFLTGRFAAKEAVVKVLGTGVADGVRLRQVEVARAASGEPRVRLTGAAARRAGELGIGRVEVSLTHKGDLVVAAAVGIPADGPAPAPAALLGTLIAAGIGALPRGAGGPGRAPRDASGPGQPSEE